jgi:hypothetical protein
MEARNVVIRVPGSTEPHPGRSADPKKESSMSTETLKPIYQNPECKKK